MNISKKYICLFWVGLFATFFMSSCQPESRYGIPDGGEARVSIQFSMQGNEVVLRATEAGRVEEDVIDHVDLYIFNKSTGDLVSHQPFAKAAIKEVNTFTFDVKASVKQNVEYTFVALANMPTGTAPASPSNIDALRKLPVNVAPASPFVMFGEVTTTVQSDNDIVHVPMARNCAAIDLANSDPTFKLEEGFWIYNIEQNGYVDADPSTVTGFKSLLSDEIQLTGATARAYTHPRNVTISETNPATFIIFKGKMANGKSAYYRTDVNVVNGQQVLEKNHIYRVMITKVTDLGYATLEEAKAATADKKVVYTVSDWDDKNQTEVSFFGNYYLGVRQKFFEFDKAQQSTTTEVFTNVPGVALIPPVNTESDPYTSASWSTLSIVYVNASEGDYLLNVGVFENAEGVERNAFGYVRATGIHTDDLKVRLDIRQVANPNYLPVVFDFNITPNEFYGSSTEAANYMSSVKTTFDRQEWWIYGVEYSKEGDNFIESISTSNGTVSYDVDNNETITGSNRYYGNGDIAIKTRTGDNTREPRAAIVRIVSGDGGSYTKWFDIFVCRDFKLDYDIDYPATLSDQMKRDKYVIETPLSQASNLDYTVKVTCNTSWETKISPAEASSWVTITNGAHQATDNNTATNPFSVRVAPNSSTPTEGGYPPARQAVITITAYENVLNAEGVIIGRTNYRTMDIRVYQGGYVKIGEDIWLDRNLKTGYRYSKEYNSDSNSDYPMLYPYAIPVGLPTDVYGAYALNNTTLNPTNIFQNGDDGFFVSGASQSGYGSNNYYNYYRGRNLTYQRVSLKGGGENAWNEKESDYQPCPPGWGVPKRSQWEFIGNLVNSGYGYGKPHDISLDPTISAQNGDMMVRNSGRYITVDPTPSTNSGLIDWYLPAAGNRLFNSVSLQFSGVYGNYKLANGYTDVENNDHFVFTHNRAYFDQQNEGVASSVRCVRVK